MKYFSQKCYIWVLVRLQFIMHPSHIHTHFYSTVMSVTCLGTAPGLEITVRYQIMSDPFWKVSDPRRFPPDILSDPFFKEDNICPTYFVHPFCGRSISFTIRKSLRALVLLGVNRLLSLLGNYVKMYQCSIIWRTIGEKKANNRHR